MFSVADAEIECFLLRQKAYALVIGHPAAYAHSTMQLLKRITQEPVQISCAIGDEYVDGPPYEVIVEIARKYIEHIGGFEKFAEWGLIK